MPNKPKIEEFADALTERGVNGPSATPSIPYDENADVVERAAPPSEPARPPVEPKEEPQDPAKGPATQTAPSHENRRVLPLPHGP